jgi:hypothetical protein
VKIPFKVEALSIRAFVRVNDKLSVIEVRIGIDSSLGRELLPHVEEEVDELFVEGAFR